MKVGIIGSGGREHALCFSLIKSKKVSKIYCIPGNAGTREIAENINIDLNDFKKLEIFIKKSEIDIVIVGPEKPLVEGVVDYLEEKNIKVFGPNKLASQLEGSKIFTKQLCEKYKIPTAKFGIFENIQKANEFFNNCNYPIVVKADGLAAGKGVTVAMNVEEALAAAEDALVGDRFGNAGASIVVEEHLSGEEVSIFALCDGDNALMLASAQDHKAVGDGDTGPNTGGMGAYSPAPIMTKALQAEIEDKIICRTVSAMRSEGIPYTGILFAGIMITEKGPKLIEFNVRFGDPECQVLMMRLKSDLLPALIAAADGELKDFDLRWHHQVALTVVLASKGYPNMFKQPTEIGNLESISMMKDVKLFHAGTALDSRGKLLAVGGRALNVTAVGKTVTEAQQKAYKGANAIDWPNGFYRHDIGWRAVARETKKSRSPFILKKCC